MVNESQDNPKALLPDVGEMLDQLIKIIPGMIVTTVGGVITSVLPGKVKIAGLPIVGYGLYMTLTSLMEKGDVIFQPEPTYPSRAGPDEAIQIVAWAHNISSDILTARMRILDRDTGEEIGPQGHIDFDMNPDQGTMITWNMTMIGPDDARIKLELGIVDDNGNYRVTDFRDITIEYAGTPAVKLFGYIREVGTGNPIFIAQIDVDGHSTSPSSDGYYEFTRLTLSGDVDITVTAPGYATQTKTVTLPEYGEEIQVDFDMVTEESITAEILNMDIDGA